MYFIRSAVKMSIRDCIQVIKFSHPLHLHTVINSLKHLFLFIMYCTIYIILYYICMQYSVYYSLVCNYKENKLKIAKPFNQFFPLTLMSYLYFFSALVLFSQASGEFSKLNHTTDNQICTLI